MQPAYIVSSVRTAIAKAPRGKLRNMRSDDLGAIVLKAALEKVPDLDLSQIEDVVFGCAFPEAEQGFNLGRVIAQRAGLPDSVAGATVNRFCASGLQAIALAHQAIVTEQAAVMVAGGAESMSLIPMGGHDLLPNPALMSELPQVYCTMGATAENVRQQYDVSRADQDAFALRSHQRAIQATQAGRFHDELIPVPIHETVYQDGKPEVVESILQTDEGPRPDTSLEALSKLPAVFRVEGTVTAGNASQTSDGAAATILVSEAKLKEFKLQPLGRMLGFAVAGVPPEVMGMGPVLAIPKVLQQVGLGLEDIGLIELNEAFAAQSLAVIRKLGLNEEIVNVNGGAIALGHPLGCTGARVTATLLHEMKRRGVRYGLASMCVGGGMGAAAVFESL
ncbi:acetyl-CoA C-acyltransferase [Leptolyngbya sp. FACHB-17]|uniref:thiolase family protein n=1 Tax=unclassified Leptolyngbya TaxID=2650499 RepID=UPI0016814A25|nr:acetyl-CoA C-acyltransferase [Leptolyngbya sp. FACHB-17]MBD2078627.1 acetyl-CoA C-acyltransferase [Leptolyngbya sp. FACHB-17]